MHTTADVQMTGTFPFWEPALIHRNISVEASFCCAFQPCHAPADDVPEHSADRCVRPKGRSIWTKRSTR